MKFRSALVGGVALVAVACGSGSGGGGTPTTPTTPTPPPGPTAPAPPPATLAATVVITPNNTFQPLEVTVLAGGRVTFINQNNRAHDITSDPPHLHTDCPPVIDVGFIQPGQTKQTGPLTVVRTCGFHDHMQENNPDLRGRIIIQGTSQ
jgi:plastocyanin